MKTSKKVRTIKALEEIALRVADTEESIFTNHKLCGLCRIHFTRKAFFLYDKGCEGCPLADKDNSGQFGCVKYYKRLEYVTRETFTDTDDELKDLIHRLLRELITKTKKTNSECFTKKGWNSTFAEEVESRVEEICEIYL